MMPLYRSISNRELVIAELGYAGITVDEVAGSDPVGRMNGWVFRRCDTEWLARASATGSIVTMKEAESIHNVIVTEAPVGEVNRVTEVLILTQDALKGFSALISIRRSDSLPFTAFVSDPTPNHIKEELIKAGITIGHDEHGVPNSHLDAWSFNRYRTHWEANCISSDGISINDVFDGLEIISYANSESAHSGTVTKVAIHTHEAFVMFVQLIVAGDLKHNAMSDVVFNTDIMAKLYGEEGMKLTPVTLYGDARGELLETIRDCGKAVALPANAVMTYHAVIPKDELIKFADFLKEVGVIKYNHVSSNTFVEAYMNKLVHKVPVITRKEEDTDERR